MFAAINVTYFVYRDSVYRQVHKITMGSPVSPHPLPLSPSLSLRSLLWLFVCMVYPKEVLIIYCHSYTMTHFLYGPFPRPLVVISNFLLYHHRRMKESFKVESHRFYDCQVKNNPMRHEESKDVNSSRQACTTRSHTYLVITRSETPHVDTAVSSKTYHSVFFSLPHSAHIWTRLQEPQLARILLLLLDIVCQPAPVIAGELMPTKVSLHMRNALVDRQKINSYHSIHIHIHMHQ